MRSSTPSVAGRRKRVVRLSCRLLSLVFVVGSALVSHDRMSEDPFAHDSLAMEARHLQSRNAFACHPALLVSQPSSQSSLASLRQMTRSSFPRESRSSVSIAPLTVSLSEAVVVALLLFPHDPSLQGTRSQASPVLVLLLSKPRAVMRSVLCDSFDEKNDGNPNTLMATVVLLFSLPFFC